MQPILKGAEPPTLTAWRESQIEAGIEPRYNDLQNPERADCRAELLREQGGICCYCNAQIFWPKMHIEHLVPQSVDRTLELVWANLLACCAPQNRKGALRTQIHCGEYRGDRSLGATPLDPDCGERFEYTLLGQMLACDNDLAAATTLSALNLTAERLRAARADLIEEAYVDLERLSEADWLASYVEADARGLFPEYPGVMRWFFETSWRAEQSALLP